MNYIFITLGFITKAIGMALGSCSSGPTERSLSVRTSLVSFLGLYCLIKVISMCQLCLLEDNFVYQDSFGGN